ncbi:MAG: DUF502 domain-containing protein [Phycisphaerae bacterium]|nr:DUF502 domain-containing protein [Phycisphaerae bacterium]
MVTGYKKWFLRGLAALLPTLITLVILMELVAFVNNNFGKYIGMGITKGIGWVWKDFQAPSEDDITSALMKNGVNRGEINENVYHKKYKEMERSLRNENLNRLGRSWTMVIIGFIVALMIVLFLGMFLASFMGRKLWRSLEVNLMRIPGIKQIYPYVKQVTDYAFGQKKMSFSRVVAIPYPRQGIWSLGFVTGAPIRAIQESDMSEGNEFLTVFVPTSPTPFTGFVVTVRKDEVLDLPLTIDQAFRFIISGGVINPEMILCDADNDDNETDSGDTA